MEKNNDSEFIRITNQDIWNRLNDIDKRIRVIEVLVGAGVFTLLGTVAKAVFA